MVMITNSFDKFPKQPTGLMYEQFGKIGINPATTPTFEDNFANATKWTQKPDSSPNADWEITGGDMNISIIRDNNPSTSTYNNNFTHDLEGELGSGNTVSDTWVWRFKFTLEAYSNGANNYGYNGGISICNMAASTNNNTTGGYGINFSTNTGNNASPSRMGSTGKEYGITFFDNAKITSGHAVDHFTLMSTSASVNQVFYVEIIRNSLTLVTCNIYSDSTYSTLTETKTRSIPSSFANRNLRYIRAFTGGDDMSGGSVLKYKIDDMKFYDGVTSLSPVSTKVKQHFIEWFSGKSIPSYWDTMGSTQILDGVDEGAYIATTGSAWSSNARLAFDVDGETGNVFSQTGSKMISVSKSDQSSGVYWINGLADIPYSPNGFYVGYFDSGTKFVLDSYGGGSTSTNTNTTVTFDTNWHKWELEINSSQTMTLKEGDTLVATRTSSPPQNTMQPFLLCQYGSQSAEARCRYMECYNT